MQFSQPSSARIINRLRVLNLVAQSEDSSRADVARLLGLNKVSTSEIVDGLIADGLVSETGKRTTAAGRRPTGLILEKDVRAVIAVDVGMKNTSVTLSNLLGEPLRFERFPTARKPSPEEMCATIIRSANKILTHMKNPAMVMGMAVAINGTVEPATGSVLGVTDWEWENVPLSVALSRHLPFPVLVENNVKAMVLGERWFGHGDTSQSLFYINWGEHIGAAWVSGGRILSNDCQFGHLPIARTGLCRCGAIGCLETVASGWALVDQALAHTQQSDTTVKQLCAKSDTDAGIDALLKRACEGMVSALISAAAILRPDRILIGGGISALPERYMDLITHSFAQRAPLRISAITKVERTALGDRAGMMGTTALALDEFFYKRTLLEQLRQQNL
ncbi:MAG: ROK family transcriptional regulator [Sphaerochaetaceae bacterium]